MQDENSRCFLPWYNVPLTEFIQSYIKPSMNIFEYGCGFSTLFYAQQSCNVYGIETRSAWIEKIQILAKQNNIDDKIHIKLCETISNFHRSILKYDITFNLTIIDSIQRMACLETVKSLYKSGTIILDNSERTNLQNAKNLMKGFQFLEFHGTRLHDQNTTSALVFYK